MTDPTARASDTAGQIPEETAAADQMVDTAPPAADPAEAAAKEAAEYRDRWMRSLAEMENLRRRIEREVADARTYGIAAFARDVLAVADSMDRAMQALDAEIRDKVDQGVKALLDGVELTERELLKALEKHGVKKIDPKGQKFDPNFHQAMYEIPDPAVPAGTVVQVVQSGYKIGERVLRPAMVGISKGGPKAGPKDSSGTQADAPANDNADK